MAKNRGSLELVINNNTIRVYPLGGFPNSLIPNIMTYIHKLDPSSKKFNCPNCNKKRFVKFIDQQGSYLPSEYGRCDRVTNCAYFKKPDSDTNGAITLIQNEPKPIFPPSYIDHNIFKASMRRYGFNSLYQHLIKRYDKSLVHSVFIKYNVGTANLWKGSTVFWQMDSNRKLRSGKIMKYDVETGKRVKKPKPLITWVHSQLEKTNYNLSQILFGEHLLPNMKAEDIICIVESEKTAIICAIECPQFIWLATGSFQMFKAETMLLLKGKKIIVFPDTDTHESWVDKAGNIEKALGTTINISNFILNDSISREMKYGYDLADVLSDKSIKPKQLISEVQEVLKKMINKNPVLQKFIDKLGLDTENATLTRNDLD